jgi:hypothetical protein
MKYAIEAEKRPAAASLETGAKKKKQAAINQKVTLLVVMNRVNPSDLEEIKIDHGVNYRTTKEKNIRPYKILYRTFSREAVERIAG